MILYVYVSTLWKWVQGEGVLKNSGGESASLVESWTAHPHKVHSHLCGDRLCNLAKSTQVCGATFSYNVINGTGRTNKLICARAQDVTLNWQDNKQRESVSDLTVPSLDVSALPRLLLLLVSHLAHEP